MCSLVDSANCNVSARHLPYPTPKKYKYIRFVEIKACTSMRSELESAHYLIENEDTDNHLYEIVQKQNIFEFVWFSVGHISGTP